jgi:hypothetical protein
VTVTTVADPLLSAGLLDEDPPHGFGSGGEEVAPAIPVLGRLPIHQAKIGLVDQRRGLERLAGFLTGHLGGRQAAQRVVDQREELLGGLRVALLDCREDAGDVVHQRSPGATTSARTPAPSANGLGVRAGRGHAPDSSLTAPHPDR